MVNGKVYSSVLALGLPQVTTVEVSCCNSMTCSFTAMVVLHVVMLHWATLYKHVKALETIIRRNPKPEYKLDKD